MERKAIITLLIILITFFVSCKKEEGEGGNNTITGRVYVLDYNSELTKLKSKYYGHDIDVFIVYGDKDNLYDDDFSTDYNGRYTFKYLYPGKYTIYTYSEDTTFKEPSGYKIVKHEVNIDGRKKTIELPDLVIVK